MGRQPEPQMPFDGASYDVVVVGAGFSGIYMLHPTSRDCVRTAFTLYGEILDAVEAAHYQVLTQRVSVPLNRRLSVALPAWRHARAVRRDANRWVPAA